MTDQLHTLLYTGWTGNLKRRMSQHRSGNGGVFTKRYNLVRLVYYEQVEDEMAARKREKQIKRGSKQQRVKLIERMNPKWDDLYDEISAGGNQRIGAVGQTVDVADLTGNIETGQQAMMHGVKIDSPQSAATAGDSGEESGCISADD